MLRENGLLFFLLLLASSCTPVYYIPNTHATPLISAKGEGDITGSFASYQMNIQAAYGFTECLASYVNIHLAPNDRWGYRGNIFSNQYELGVGTFSVNHNKSIIELYAIGSWGHIRNNMDRQGFIFGRTITEGGVVESDFWRYGFQFNYGLKYTNLELGVSNRFHVMHYYNTNGNLTYDEQDQIRSLQLGDRYFYWEPAATLRFGLENFKFFCQIGVSYNLTNPSFFYYPLVGSAGLTYSW